MKASPTQPSRGSDRGTALGPVAGLLTSVLTITYITVRSTRRPLGRACRALSKGVAPALGYGILAIYCAACAFIFYGLAVRPLERAVGPRIAWPAVLLVAAAGAVLVRYRHAPARLLEVVARRLGGVLLRPAPRLVRVVAQTVTAFARLCGRILCAASHALVESVVVPLARSVVWVVAEVGRLLVEACRTAVRGGLMLGAPVARAVASCAHAATLAAAVVRRFLGRVARGVVAALAQPVRQLVADVGSILVAASRALLRHGLMVAVPIARTVAARGHAAARAAVTFGDRVCRLAEAVAAAIAQTAAPLAGAARTALSAASAAVERAGRPVRARPGLSAATVALVFLAASAFEPPLGILFLLPGIYAAWRLVRLLVQALGRLGERQRRRLAHTVQVASAKARFAAARSAPEATEATPHTRVADVARPPFELAVHENPYLPSGGVEVEAIVTVTCEAAMETPVEAAEVILVDCSGSMAYPLAKLREAHRATAGAIDALRDGTWFAVVRGADTAEPLYPRSGLAPANRSTRQQAKDALRLLWAEGGTALGSWLLAASDLLSARPNAIRHAILLTDGRDESESSAELDAALAACRGAFQCDCRGVGTDWEVDELRRISSALLGTVDIVSDASELEDDFRAIVDGAMAKRTRDVTLRLWTPRGAEVRYVRQVAPAVETLSGSASGSGPLLTDYPTGAWGAESRAYHISLRVPGHGPGEEMLAGAVSILVDGRVAGRALIRALWTEDSALAAEIAPEVAHYRGQTELAAAIRAGLAARRVGDEQEATVQFGRAARLATDSGNDAMMRLLERVVEVEDAAAGAVRPRPQVDEADEMALDTRSTRSVRVGGSAA